MWGGGKCTSRLGSAPRAPASNPKAVAVLLAVGRPHKSAVIRHTRSRIGSALSWPLMSLALVLPLRGMPPTPEEARQPDQAVS